MDLISTAVAEFRDVTAPAAAASSDTHEVNGGKVEGLEHLATGKIIRARIPQVREDGSVDFYERTCLVLGLEAVPGKPGVTGVYVSRFNFIEQKQYDEYGYVLDHYARRLEGIVMESKSQGASNVPRSTVLRTDRIDLIPANPFYLGGKLEIVGYVTKHDIMLEMGDAVMQGLNAEGAEASRGPRARLPDSELRQTFEPGMEPLFPKFPLGKLVRRSSLLQRAGQDDYERALIQSEIQMHEEASRIGYEERMAARLAAGETAEEEPARAPRLKYIKPVDVRKGRRREFSSSRINAIVSRVNDQVRKNREAAGLEAPRDPGHLNERAHDVFPGAFRRKAKTGEQAQAAPYFSHGANYTPMLPPDLKRHDIVVLKIADIMDPEDKRPAQRPCVVWNVYEDKETGAVCGLEVFPRTRLRAHQFDSAYTSSFPNLYRRNVWDGGYLLAQRIARVAVTEEHFHPVTKRIQPLNALLFDELTDKRKQCEDDGKVIAPFGLAEIPDNWRLRDSESRELSLADANYAAHVLDQRDRQLHAVQQAPQVGDIVLRKLMREGKESIVPVLIWGVWNHKITGYPAAFDCVRIDWKPGAKNAWSVDLEIDPAQFDVEERPSQENWRADLAMIDLVPNTGRFFEEGQTAQIIGRIDSKTLELMEKRRADILVKNRKRGGQYPEFLRFDWTRVDGCSFGFNPANLASSKFAPDLDYFNLQPGQLRHNKGRDNNRRGLPPRRKNEGFKKKPKPSMP